MTDIFQGNGGAFYFCGYYLAPAPNHRNTSWMGKRAHLASIGWGFAILYVGRQLRSHHLTYAQGQTDGNAAVNLAQSEGFTDSIIYLDIEAGGGQINATFLQYIVGWLDAVDATSFYPGVYCSYSRNATQIKNARPSMKIYFWIFRVGGKSPGCTTHTRHLTPASCGVKYAYVWQYKQDCPSITTNGVVIRSVDLDLAKVTDPSANPT